MRIGTEMIDALRYKLQMFGVLIDGPANVFCDNGSSYGEQYNLARVNITKET
jgi:hypothetical protein